MWYVDNQGKTLPQINLAIEEYLLRNVLPEEDLLFLYINEPSIIVGRFQNTLEEVNQRYVEDHNLHVVRRLSGGGAVYHDLNNLNYSFITAKDPESISNFKKFTAPVIRTLNEMGIPAELGTRNEILVKGLKISGNAQYITGKRMVSHGTLLFNSDLSRLGEALHVVPGTITSKSIKSIRSQVTNIASHLPEPMEMSDFRRHILEGIFAGINPIPQYQLTEADWHAVYCLVDERYARWKWNYGSSPDFTVQKSGPFPAQELTIKLDVHQGAIRTVHIQGSMIGEEDRIVLTACLTGVRYDRRHIQAAFEAYHHLLRNRQLAINEWVALLV